MSCNGNTILTMILNAFSKYLQKYNTDLINCKTTATKLLCQWLKLIITKTPKTNTDKIIHKEILLAQNDTKDYILIGKSESGRTLLKALNNFALSYENYIMSKWLSDKKPKHFINNPKNKN